MTSISIKFDNRFWIFERNDIWFLTLICEWNDHIKLHPMRVTPDEVKQSTATYALRHYFTASYILHDTVTFCSVIELVPLRQRHELDAKFPSWNVKIWPSHICFEQNECNWNRAHSYKAWSIPLSSIVSNKEFCNPSFTYVSWSPFTFLKESLSSTSFQTRHATREVNVFSHIIWT